MLSIKIALQCFKFYLVFRDSLLLRMELVRYKKQETQLDVGWVIFKETAFPYLIFPCNLYGNFSLCWAQISTIPSKTAQWQTSTKFFLSHAALNRLDQIKKIYRKHLCKVLVKFCSFCPNRVDSGWLMHYKIIGAWGQETVPPFLIFFFFLVLFCLTYMYPQ